MKHRNHVRILSSILCLVLLLFPVNAYAAPESEGLTLSFSGGEDSREGMITPMALLSGVATVERKGSGNLELYARVLNDANEATFFWPTLQRKEGGQWVDYMAFSGCSSVYFCTTVSIPTFYEYRLTVCASSVSIPVFWFYSDSIWSF